MAINDFTGQNIQDTYQRVVQTDGTNLADGAGSLLPVSFDGNNVIISGSLTAQTYVVSESITAVSSGSTIFCNTQDDTHLITGSLNVTGSVEVNGDLVSKGNITLGFGKFLAAEDVSGNVDDTILVNFADTQLTVGDGDSLLRLIGNGIEFSAGGGNDILIPNLVTTTKTQLGNDATDVTSISGSISAVTHITSSGNISTSGKLIGTINGGSFN